VIKIQLKLNLRFLKNQVQRRQKSVAWTPHSALDAIRRLRDDSKTASDSLCCCVPVGDKEKVALTGSSSLHRH
jgi:hypothetical protein